MELLHTEQNRSSSGGSILTQVIGSPNSLGWILKSDGCILEVGRGLTRYCGLCSSQHSFTLDLIPHLSETFTSSFSLHFWDNSSFFPISGFVTMAVDLATTVQAFLPRVVVYTIIGTTAAWLLHLMQPAFQAALSKDYQKFNWAGDKKGVGTFMKASYEVALKSQEYFKETHRKVGYTVCPLGFEAYKIRFLKLAMEVFSSFQSPTAARASCSWCQSNC